MLQVESTEAQAPEKQVEVSALRPTHSMVLTLVFSPANGNEKNPPHTFGRESMRTCRMFSFFPPNSKSSLEILKLSG